MLGQAGYYDVKHGFHGDLGTVQRAVRGPASCGKRLR